MPLDGHARPTVLFETNSQGPRFSPDGRWIAYASDETGRFEIYVQSFPPGRGKWTISREGARTARWRGDGRELYYLALNGAIMAVDATPRNGQLEFGAARRLFESGASNSAQFDVSPDGQRFAYPAASGERSIIVVTNWLAGVKR
jgi:Tol biopolymer transport system component